MLGVLVGTLPQVPQQNVFQGIPLELMPEEARLLMESGLAYIVNDRDWHRDGIGRSGRGQLQAYQQELTRKGLEAVKSIQSQKAEATEKVLKKLELNKPSKPSKSRSAGTVAHSGAANEGGESLFDSSDAPQFLSDTSSSKADTKPWAITPATSYPPLTRPPQNPEVELPAVKPASYAIFKHLHEQGYYLSPGLRFGCQFTAYPGDPLRYHSHFLAVGVDWEEKIDMMDIIGGGRLGTGVKKGFLLGGTEGSKGEDRRERVRTFCLEWAGM